MSDLTLILNHMFYEELQIGAELSLISVRGDIQYLKQGKASSPSKIRRNYEGTYADFLRLI